MLSGSLPGQSNGEPAIVQELRQRVTAANAQGFAALLAIRHDLAKHGTIGEPGGLEVLELATRAFLAWCPDVVHGAAAAQRAVAFATRFAQGVLVTEHDPTRSLGVIEPAWAYRDQAGYWACELALIRAVACRQAADYAGAQEALDYYLALGHSAARKQWEQVEAQALMLAIHDLQHECRRALLELSLGNWDGALQRVREAGRMTAAPRFEARADPADFFASAWRSAKVELYRTQIDCCLGTESFAAAVRAAERALELPLLEPDERTLFDFYLAMSRSWNPASTSEQMDAAQATLLQFAEYTHPALRQLALVRLVERAAQQGDAAQGNEYLGQLLASTQGALDPRGTTLQTQLLLLQDARLAVPLEQLVQQRQAQQRAFEALLAGWRATPARDGGVGFLHYLDRREAIGQLIAISLRAAAPNSEATQAAAAEALEHAMAAQVHGALARRLATEVPTTGSLQSLLLPDQGVLLFLPVASHTHVFAITAAHIAHVSLDQGALAIRPDIHAFVDLLQQATSRLDHGGSKAKELATRLRAVGERLAKTLVPDALRQQLATWKSLTIIGSELLHGPVSGAAEAGFLNYLPIECLPWNDSELFGQHFAIDHNSSLPVWVQLANRDAPPAVRSPLRVFGVLTPRGGKLTSDTAPGIAAADRLSPQWAQQLGAPFRDPELCVDEHCTLATVGARRLADGLAVFLAHGGYDGSVERGSYLQLYDGRLDCRGAQALGDPAAPFARLVVLAACRAAKGPNRTGDSLANLGGAFLQAGATTVVQSRFDLPLHRAQSLLTDLLQHIAAGATTAEAMRKARCNPTGTAAADPLDAYRTGVLQVHGFGQSPRRR